MDMLFVVISYRICSCWCICITVVACGILRASFFLFFFFYFVQCFCFCFLSKYQVGVVLRLFSSLKMHVAVCAQQFVCKTLLLTNNNSNNSTKHTTKIINSRHLRLQGCNFYCGLDKISVGFEWMFKVRKSFQEKEYRIYLFVHLNHQNYAQLLKSLFKMYFQAD